MNVKITSIEDAGDNARVVFWTSIGSGQAEWVGLRPEVGSIYDAELEIPETLVWKESIRTVQDKPPGISISGNRNIITGVLEGIDENDVATIRLGNSVLLLDTEGEHAPVGSTVEVATSRLSLYDSNT